MFGKKEKKQEEQKQEVKQEEKMLTQADKIKQTTDIITSSENILDGYTQEEINQIIETTGTENMVGSRRIPMIVWNLDMRDEDGKDIRPDMFYNCMSHETYKKMHLALLMADSRCREKSIYDEKTRQKTIICRTTDGQVGIEYPTGNMRDCENCQDKIAKKGERKSCTPVINIIAYDLERNQPVVIRAMRSNYVPFSNYIERYHFKQLNINGKRVDLPLYMLWMELTLKEESGRGKRYYVANPKCMGRIEEKSTVLALKNMAERLKQMKDIETEESAEAKYYHGDVKSQENSSQEEEDVPF